MTSLNHGRPSNCNVHLFHHWLSGQLMATRGSFAVSATGLTWAQEVCEVHPIHGGWGPKFETCSSQADRVTIGCSKFRYFRKLIESHGSSAPDCMQIPAVTKETGQPAVQGLHLNASDSMKPVGLSREKAWVCTRHTHHTVIHVIDHDSKARFV